ncbi:MAG TPA: pyruvate dehydrogenase complex dihydrolipoamide acetyltransferase [Rhizomicrobium sp.]|nr:pyruvate dehydrogenase complex dihydrolipoamide acetyltransferase [Rhizomicrobium sp.]
MTTQILMPALSPTMEEGKLAKWLVKEGDEVKSGDILAEIETDKATMEFEAVDEGRIEKILVPEGSEAVKVNTPIAVLVGEGEDAGAPPTDISSAMASIKDAVSNEATAQGSRSALEGEPKSRGDIGGGAKHADSKSLPEPPSRQRASADSTFAQGQAGSGRIFASPLARRIAEQKGVELSAIAGTGPRGRIVKADVEGASLETRPAAASEDGAKRARHLEERGSERQRTDLGVSKGDGSMVAPLPDARLFYKPDDYDEIPHDSMRKAIARRLSSSKALIPHFYLTVDCNIDRLLAARARLNESAKGAIKLSVNDFVVKAAAMALMRVPEVNASWTDTAILRHKHADVGVAVALDFGLITPIVFRAEEKGLAAISNEVKSLAERARAKKLKPQEFEGGGFAVSNLGMYGIKEFTGVINPPHAAILAVGAGESRPVVREGRVEIATVMTVTMSCDHRVIDGAAGARFLGSFKQFIEEPAAMLL